MSIVLFIISRHISFSGLSFLLFTMTSTITFSALLSLCWFGYHVLLFPGSMAMMLWFQASFSRTSWDFFSFFFFHLTNRPKIREGHSSSGVGGGEMASSVFFLNFSSAGNWPFLTGKKYGPEVHCPVGGGGGGIGVWWGTWPFLPGKGLGVKFSEMPFPHFKTYFRQIGHCKLSVFRSGVNYFLKSHNFYYSGLKHLLLYEVSCIPFPF